MYNPAIAKFLSVDPLSPDYPELTPYQFASNTPIMGTDLDGLEVLIFHQETRDFISILGDQTSGSGLGTTSAKIGGIMIGRNEEGNFVAAPFVAITFGGSLGLNTPKRMHSLQVGWFISKGIYEIDEWGYNFGLWGAGSKIGEINSDGSVIFENIGFNVSLIPIPTDVIPDKKIPGEVRKKGSVGGYLELSYSIVLGEVLPFNPSDFNPFQSNAINIGENEITYNEEFGEIFKHYFQKLENLKAQKTLEEYWKESEESRKKYEKELEKYKKQLEELNEN